MSHHDDYKLKWQELCRDRNMVTAVKRWITYEVGDGSSVGAVVFRLGCQYFEDKVLGSFGFPQKQCISTWLWSFFGPSSLKHPQWHVSCCFPWECTLLLSHWISLTVKKYDQAAKLHYTSCLDGVWIDKKVWINPNNSHESLDRSKLRPSQTPTIHPSQFLNLLIISVPKRNIFYALQYCIPVKVKMGYAKPMATFNKLKCILTIIYNLYQGSSMRDCITLC